VPATTSAIYAVRTALFERIKALADPDTQVARVMDTYRDREGIFLGDSTTGSEEARAFSGGTRRRSQESFDTDVRAWAVNTTPDECERRAVELAGVVEDILADDAKLGGVPGLIASYVTAWSLSVQFMDEHEMICAISITVTSEVRKQ